MIKKSGLHRKKRLKLLIGFTVVLLVLLMILSIAIFLSLRHKEPYEQVVKIGNKKVYVEIADTDEEQTKGLSGRGNMSENHGMLFVFQNEAQHAFWMKDTLIPLDLIYFDKGMRVTDIKGNFEPCLSGACIAFIPRHKAMYVLEVNAGFVDKYKINGGDELKILKRLEQRAEETLKDGEQELKEIKVSDSLIISN